jgi:hypothetical protein
MSDLEQHHDNDADLYKRMAGIVGRHKVIFGVLVEEEPGGDGFHMHIFLNNNYHQIYPQRVGVIITEVMKGVASAARQSGFDIQTIEMPQEPDASPN